VTPSEPLGRRFRCVSLAHCSRPGAGKGRACFGVCLPGARVLHRQPGPAALAARPFAEPMEDAVGRTLRMPMAVAGLAVNGDALIPEVTGQGHGYCRPR